MSKIKFRIEAWDKTVVFQVLEMDERFRSSHGEPDNVFHSRGGLAIKSCVSPELKSDDVFLRGASNGADRRVEIISFATKKEADDYRSKVIDALGDWAENWKGWGKEVEDETPFLNITQNVFEF